MGASRTPRRAFIVSCGARAARVRRHLVERGSGCRLVLLAAKPHPCARVNGSALPPPGWLGEVTAGRAAPPRLRWPGARGPLLWSRWLLEPMGLLWAGCGWRLDLLAGGKRKGRGPWQAPAPGKSRHPPAALARNSSIQILCLSWLMSPATDGVASGTWKAERKAREKASRWPGARALSRSCSAAMAAGSRGASGPDAWLVGAFVAKPCSPSPLGGPLKTVEMACWEECHTGGSVGEGGEAPGLLAAGWLGRCRAGRADG